MAKKKKGQQNEKELFQIFGEFNSAEEINQAAQGLRQEGDTEMLRKLAEENGLEEEVELFLSGETDELCDPISAALGKLKVERKNEDNCLADDVADYLSSNCDDVGFARAVRRKGKRIGEAASCVMEEARKHSTKIEGRTCHYCGPMRGYQLIREYYTKG